MLAPHEAPLLALCFAQKWVLADLSPTAKYDIRAGTIYQEYGKSTAVEDTEIMKLER